MVLTVDWAVFGKVPSAMTCVGAAIVFLSITGISFSDQAQIWPKIKSLIRNTKRSEDDNDNNNDDNNDKNNDNNNDNIMESSYQKQPNSPEATRKRSLGLAV
jgi:hypothetical protein